MDLGKSERSVDAPTIRFGDPGARVRLVIGCAHRVRKPIMRGISALAMLLLASCAGNTPRQSSGGDDVVCPDGSANPGKTIRTVNCSTVVQYDGDEFESALDVQGLAAAGIKNADVALREVSEAANDAQIQFSQTCELYNGCNLTSDEYRQRLDETQAHFRRIREQVSLLEAAQGNPEMLRAAFARLYVATVPESRVAETSLGVEFSLQARQGGQVQVIRDGQTLRTGDEVVFGLRTSKAAHVYIFQKKPTGKIDVLFPNDAISSMRNPIPANQLVRIPPKGQVFTLDDQDLGLETIYIAASTTPLSDLEAALSGVDDTGESKQVAQAMDHLFDEAAPECAEQTRGLDLAEESDCGRSRGFAPKASSRDDFFTDAASVQAQSAPGDDVVIRAFSFNHTN